MPYNTQPIKVDVDGRPIPQYFDPVRDEYQPLLGEGGATWVVDPYLMRGLAASRPPAGAVPLGTVYWSVDTGDVSVSTGAEWRSLGVA